MGWLSFAARFTKYLSQSGTLYNTASTYYSEEFAEDIEKQAAKLLTSDRLSFTKGSILIIGRDLFAS